jgi:hypothetical protein
MERAPQANTTAPIEPVGIEPPARTAMRDMILILGLSELLLVALYRVYNLLTKASVKGKRVKSPSTSSSLLLERVADRLALDRNTDDASSQVTAVGFGSTLNRETSHGRNRRRGQSGSGHGLAREAYS